METVVAVAMTVKNAKCSQLFVLLVEKKPRFLSNRLRIDPFIAANAMYHRHVTLIKLFIVETFLGVNSPLGRFFVVHLGMVNNFMVKTADVVNFFTITSGKEMPFAETKTTVGWLRHSLFANRTFRSLRGECPADSSVF